MRVDDAEVAHVANRRAAFMQLAHGVKLWCGDDWYLDQSKVGKTINPDPFTEVVWSVAEEEGKNARAKRG